jgi:hypothetical protein
MTQYASFCLAVLGFDSSHAYDYRIEGLRLYGLWTPKGAKKGKPITPRTVRRAINSISHVFAIARRNGAIVV